MRAEQQLFLETADSKISSIGKPRSQGLSIGCSVQRKTPKLTIYLGARAESPFRHGDYYTWQVYTTSHTLKLSRTEKRSAGAVNVTGHGEKGELQMAMSWTSRELFDYFMFFETDQPSRKTAMEVLSCDERNGVIEHVALSIPEECGWNGPNIRRLVMEPEPVIDADPPPTNAIDPASIATGVLFDFIGHLTGRNDLVSINEATAARLVKEFCELRGVPLSAEPNFNWHMLIRDVSSGEQVGKRLRELAMKAND